MLAALALALWVFRRPLEAWYGKRATGLQAAQDASTQNGYTTYNTQIYRAPWWQPSLKFLKAGAYVPAGQGNNAGGQPSDYSVQG